MNNKINRILNSHPIGTSAPCRIDMGGTLDISTFSNPLRHFKPCTFNIALNLRTKVKLLPYDTGMVRISSKGFDDAKYPLNEVPFDHPMGLMFAVAAYFNAGGVHIDIHSSSPPRSALGGSSAAALALIKAFYTAQEKIGGQSPSVEKTAILAHTLEQSVAGVPCGMQDQLAAAFGGVNAWYWQDDADAPLFKKESIFNPSSYDDLEKHLLIAYCGIPHESKDVNGRWVRQFLKGKNRNTWVDIVKVTKKFVEYLSVLNYREAGICMNRETALRKKMTPDVLDDMGDKLAGAAVKHNCGARFTGAGGGGCVWAIGEEEDISKLKEVWQDLLSERETAYLLNAKIDANGVLPDSQK